MKTVTIRCCLLCCIIPVVAFALCGQPDAASTSPQAESAFEPLFNGKDLNGWKFVVEEGTSADRESIFQVKGGVIHVYPDAEAGSRQPFAGIYTDRSFKDFHLSLEYKWGEKKFQPRHEAVRDAGVIFHLVGTPKIWPTGIECQIQEGDTGDMWIIGQTRASSPVQSIAGNYSDNGDLITRGADRGYQRFQRSQSWEKPGWNRVELIVREDDAKFFVNGHLVNEAINMRYREDPESEWDWRSLRSGPVFLQAEGAEVYYRNIRIRRLEEN